MKNLDVGLIRLHDQIDSDRFNLIDLLTEVNNLYFNEDLSVYS